MAACGPRGRRGVDDRAVEGVGLEVAERLEEDGEGVWVVLDEQEERVEGAVGDCVGRGCLDDDLLEDGDEEGERGGVLEDAGEDLQEELAGVHALVELELGFHRGRGHLEHGARQSAVQLEAVH